ncbi:hypothetical protein ACQJBY_041307 [Aegilops geniculata]
MDNNLVTAAITAQEPPLPPVSTLGSIASRWHELHGARSWHGLLDPIDDDLRAFVIAYGEHAAAAYDGFNAERRSPRVGSCLYSRANLLAACGVSCPGHYTVTKFLYGPTGLWLPESTSASPAIQAATEPFFVRPLREEPLWKEANWMGYVAVATDEGAAALGRRDIVVSWRGTVTKLENLNDGDWLHAPATKVLSHSMAAAYKDARVHHGFLSVYTSADKEFKHNNTSLQDQVREEVRRLLQVHKDEEVSITVTGHSLGASLATLNAVDMVAHGINVPPAYSKQSACPVTAILFASPRVGNGGFKAAIASFPDLRALSVRNEFDPVPSLPMIGYEEGTATEVLCINTTKSQCLRKFSVDLFRFWKDHHNLEVYLHGIAGYQGASKEFCLVVNRDVALLNKWADLLKDEHLAPANWWVAQNKCMVRGVDGHWKFDDYEDDQLSG